MSSIIPFRFGAASERQDGDLSALLAAGTESINTSALAYERLIPAVRDWTNQEMADLARVQYLLSRAGVPLETDRGITDEGDPWYVFCDLNGEVFVHICRMGVTYLLDSPSLETPLKGLSFEALVKSFIDRATAKVAALNVVPLSKDNKVYLHPSVMLTALIWSLLLLNDQMTNAAYASTAEESQHAAADQHYDVETAFALLADALQDNGHDLHRVGDHRTLSKFLGSDRDIANPDKLTSTTHSPILNSTVIASLSAIALAFGLLQPAESIAANLPDTTIIAASTSKIEVTPVLISEGTERHAPAKVDEGAHTLDDHQLTHDAGNVSLHVVAANAIAESISALKVISLDLIGVLAHNRDVSMGAPASSIVAGDAMDDGGVSVQTFGRAAPAVRTESTTSTATSANTNDTGAKETAAASTPTFSLTTNSSPIRSFAQLADQIIKHAEGLIVVSSTEAQPAAVTKIVGHVHEMLTTYADNTSDTVKQILKFEVTDSKADTKNETVSLDVTDTSSSKTDAVVEAVTVVVSQPKASTAMPVETVPTHHQFGTYNPAAKELVDYLLSKQKDVVVINLPNEIIILDKSALDEATDVAFAKSWSVEGGGVVSTIGHFSDYRDFGLLG